MTQQMIQTSSTYPVNPRNFITNFFFSVSLFSLKLKKKKIIFQITHMHEQHITNLGLINKCQNTLSTNNSLLLTLKPI